MCIILVVGCNMVGVLFGDVLYVCVVRCGWMKQLCFFFKRMTGYNMRISDWSSDVCSSDLAARLGRAPRIKVDQIAPCLGMDGKIHDSLASLRRTYRAGSVPGFEYSAAMKHSQIVWSRATIDDFIAHPTKTIPGPSMCYAGVTDPTVRAAQNDNAQCRARGSQ